MTYLKAFDEIRAVFADTVEARTRGYDAGHFSFNVDGGRCSACHGDGYIQIDMQFLADVYMHCASATAPATATKSSTSPIAAGTSPTCWR